ECVQTDPSGGADVCSDAGDQDRPSIAPTGFPCPGECFGRVNSGTVVAWQDARNGSDLDIYARHLDRVAPPAAWDSAAIAICSAPGDQSDVTVRGDEGGGATLAWVDRRSGAADLYAQRVDSAGVAQWTAGGIPLCDAVGDQTDLVM